jgi:hypothetical protein
MISHDDGKYVISYSHYALNPTHLCSEVRQGQHAAGTSHHLGQQYLLLLLHGSRTLAGVLHL